VPDVDFVTGLASRAAFEALLDGVRAEHDALAAVICDVVGLKVVNERDGFAAGDACLRSAADRLRTAATGATLTARLGGDELVAVFLGPEADGVARHTARVLAMHGTPALRSAADARRPDEAAGPFIDRLYASLRRS